MNDKAISDLHTLRNKLIRLEFQLYQDESLTEHWLAAQECACLAGELLIQAVIARDRQRSNRS